MSYKIIIASAAITVIALPAAAATTSKPCEDERKRAPSSTLMLANTDYVPLGLNFGDTSLHAGIGFAPPAQGKSNKKMQEECLLLSKRELLGLPTVIE